MLDVGQGDCLHLTYASSRSALVDTGGSGDATRRDFVGEKVVARYLWENRISTLDSVLLSHAHRDHTGGLDFLKIAFPIGQIYQGPRERATEAGVSLSAGDCLEFEGMRMQVLHPPRSVTFRDSNDESLVLLITYGEFRALLTGAVSVPPVEIIKAAHHRSRNSNSVEFLQKAAPQLALISAGRWNPFGHPSPFTLARLSELGIDWLATPDSGSIRVETDGHTWQASVWDHEERRFKVVRTGVASSGQEKLSSPNSPNPFLSSTFLSK
jgi:competence protein ComEC